MNPIKTGIWGLGRAGWQMHRRELALYPEMFTLTAGCDIEPDRVELLQKSVPGSRGYRDAGEFLRDPDMELVAIATRSNDHMRHCRMALEAGKYVFLEKPIALSYDDALKLRSWSGEFPGRLYFRFNRRFEAAFSHVRQIIASGILGEVFEVALRRHHYHRREDWQTLCAEGGGILNNWGPHLIDHALQFLQSPVKDVWSDLKLISSAGDAEDYFKVLLRGENGRTVDVEVSSSVAAPAWVYAVYGVRGTLTAADEKNLHLRYLRPGQPLPALKASNATPGQDYGFGKGEELDWIEEDLPVAPASGENIDRIYWHLFRAIREHVPFPITVDEAVEVMRIIDLAGHKNQKITRMTK